LWFATSAAEILGALDFLQVGEQVGGALVALVAILLQSLANNLFDARWDTEINGARGNRLASKNSFNDGAAGAAAESLAAGGHFVEHETERKDVGAGVEVVAANLFRRHVGGSSADDSDDRGGILGVAATGEAGGYKFSQAEIKDFGLATFCDEDIGGFDVAMHDAFGVSGIESFGDLDSQLQYFLKSERRLMDVSAESFAVDEFHGDEGAAVLFADVVDGADTGVVEGGGGAGFAAEAFESLRVVRGILGEKLESYEALEASVFGFIDDAHAPGADVLDHEVVRDGLADEGAGRHGQAMLDGGGETVNEAAGGVRSTWS